MWFAWDPWLVWEQELLTSNYTVESTVLEDEVVIELSMDHGNHIAFLPTWRPQYAPPLLSREEFLYLLWSALFQYSSMLHLVRLKNTRNDIVAMFVNCVYTLAAVTSDYMYSRCGPPF